MPKGGRKGSRPKCGRPNKPPKAAAVSAPPAPAVPPAPLSAPDPAPATPAPPAAPAPLALAKDGMTKGKPPKIPGTPPAAVPKLAAAAVAALAAAAMAALAAAALGSPMGAAPVLGAGVAVKRNVGTARREPDLRSCRSITTSSRFSRHRLQSRPRSPQRRFNSALLWPISATVAASASPWPCACGQEVPAAPAASPPGAVEEADGTLGKAWRHTGQRLDSRESHLSTQGRWKRLPQQGILTPR